MQSSLKLLLIEDDRSIASTLAQILSSHYLIDSVNSGKLALYRADTYAYDLVLLDLNLPDISGLDVCQQLRQRGIKAPILILSGESRLHSKISVLDAGANDYLTKPFSLGELLARIRVLTRKTHLNSWPAAVLKSPSVTIDRRTFSVHRDNQLVLLRPKEFDILVCLMERANEVVSRKELIETVWPQDNEPWDNTLDVHIKYLRDRLDRPFPSALIQTVHGRGYKFVDTERVNTEADKTASVKQYVN